MSNDYGLVVKNANGDIQFDSRRQMSSYVVSYSGTASSVSVGSDCLVFVKGGSSVSNKTVFGKLTLSGTYEFYAYDYATSTASSVSLPCFVATRSADITPATGDSYGLVIKNPDGSIQFDSRSLQTNDHFRTTDVWKRLELTGNPATSSDLVTSTDEYVEIKNWSYSNIGTGPITNTVVRGVTFLGASGNQPRFESWIEFEEQGQAFFSYQRNRKVILVGELD